jgi:hypothetical protein
MQAMARESTAEGVSGIVENETPAWEKRGSNWRMLCCHHRLDVRYIRRSLASIHAISVLTRVRIPV